MRSVVLVIEGAVVVLLAGGLPVLFPAPPSDAPGGAAVESITSSELRSIVGFLAADQMEGRQTGSQANHLVSLYLAHQLELLGLTPAGDDGGFLQEFRLHQTRLGSANRLEFRGEGSAPSEGVLLDTFFPLPNSGTAAASGLAVWVGLELFDERGDLDPATRSEVNARIAVMPAGDTSRERNRGVGEAAGVTRTARILALQRAGVAGVVLVEPPGGRGFSRMARMYWPRQDSWSRYRLPEVPEAVRIPVVMVARSLVAPWFGDSMEEDPESKPASRGPVRPGGQLEVVLEVDLEGHQTPSHNVLALLEGSDPMLRHEVVVVSAHLDHVGGPGGQIFNGADDNASGTAAVLEVAEAFALSELRPRRSVLIAFWNAEEHGLLGARHYVEAENAPLERIRALFQMDMVGRDQEVTDRDDPRFRGLEVQSAEQNRNTVHMIGYSFSDHLRDVVERASVRAGVDLLTELDQHPLNLVRRSDHWPFLQRGIPATLISTGLHPDYHTPEDRVEKLNFPKMERIARMVFLAAWESADGTGPLELNRTM